MSDNAVPADATDEPMPSNLPEATTGTTGIGIGFLCRLQMNKMYQNVVMVIGSKRGSDSMNRIANDL